MGTDRVPVFELKATDAFTYPVLVYYARYCREFGNEVHAQETSKTAEEIRVWQQNHRDLVGFPFQHHVPQE